MRFRKKKREVKFFKSEKRDLNFVHKMARQRNPNMEIESVNWISSTQSNLHHFNFHYFSCEIIDKPNPFDSIRSRSVTLRIF